MRVLAIDPGTAKCGVAVVEPGGKILHLEIVLTEQLASRVAELCAQYSPAQLLMGNGTQSKALAALLPEVIFVPEAYTSQRARQRLSVARPWWLRWLPLTQPYDDLVAVILAEDWLAGQESRLSLPK
ncbi:MAG: pre-16S rRNA-processing nuclease YqgF [Armatimonadetes bacterium]|nr:pre-16S rRNA-processing nuclease YqgF [Armatimonadota bacterium]